LIIVYLKSFSYYSLGNICTHSGLMLPTDKHIVAMCASTDMRKRINIKCYLAPRMAMEFVD
jgi:hypothetical protein